jgi:hypothetical protein
MYSSPPEPPLSSIQSALAKQRGALLVLAAWLLLVWVAVRLAGPDSLESGGFNSDTAIPLLMAQHRDHTAFSLYYWGQDRFGAWPFLLGSAWSAITGFEWNPERLSLVTIAWASIGVLLLMNLAQTRQRQKGSLDITHSPGCQRKLPREVLLSPDSREPRLLASGPSRRPIIVFDLAESRGGDVLAPRLERVKCAVSAARESFRVLSSRIRAEQDSTEHQ